MFYYIEANFYPFTLHEIPVSVVLTLGQLRYLFAAVPPQPNSQLTLITSVTYAKLNNSMSSGISTVVTLPLILHLTNHPTHKTRVKHKRDFFPRCRFRPVPLTEVSLTDIEGQLVSR